MAVIDPSQTLDLTYSRGKPLGLMLLGILMTAGAALIAFHVIPVQPGSLQEFLGGDVMHRQKFVVLAIDPAVEASLTRPRSARLLRGTNKAFGIDGLTVSAVGLKTNHAALMAAILAYAEAWRGIRESSPRPPAISRGRH